MQSASDGWRGETGRAIAALVGVQLLFGTHYSVAREITSYLDPLAWTAIRQLGGLVVLLGLALALRRRWPRGARTWAHLLLLGVLGVALNQLLFNAGIRRSSALHGVLVMATVPAQTLALGVMMRQEVMTRRKLVSVLLGALGICLLLQVDDLAGGTGGWLRTRDGAQAHRFSDTVLCGDLMMIANSVCYALFLALGKRTSQEMDPLTLSAAIYVCAAPLAALVCAPALLAVDYPGVPLHVWLLGAAVIVGPTALAYLLNLYALRRLPTSLVGLFINVQFVIAAATATLWHAEQLDRRMLIAAALVLVGLALRFLPERTGPAGQGARDMS